MRGEAAILLSAALAIGCRGFRTRASEGDGPTDAAFDSGVAAVVDAAPPPDETLPQPSPEELSVRAKHLLEAIAKGDAQLATDILFPRDGWVATRAVADPGKEWDKRVGAPFRRAVHRLSKRYADFDRAQFVSIELGRELVQETPKAHGWKKPLWTVRASHMTFVVDGRTRTLAIREMTAWRGAWYVSRLR